MKCSFLIATVFAVALAPTARAYELPNHFDMSTLAASKSVLGDPATMKKLGLRGTFDDFSLVFPSAPTGDDPQLAFECRFFSEMTVRDLIGCGSQFEDIPARQSLNHFYDPVRNIPLTFPGISLLGLPNLRSPDWALQDPGAEINAAQQRAYRNAREYFHTALTSTEPAVRDSNWGLTFQTLGQVIHHLQDMSQPQHVRNDVHCDAIFPCLIPFGVLGLYNPSLYERYGTRVAPAVAGFASGADGSGIYPGPNDAYRALFVTPRRFFVGSGKGIAEFTNLNFVSEGTNFGFSGGVARANAIYADPAPGPAGSPVGIASLYPPAGVPPFLQSACNFDPANCFMTFYSTSGTDPLTGAAMVNPRASTLSIFDSSLEGFGATVQYTDALTGQLFSTQKVFSLNTFNFDGQQQRLIPRATAYSAGLINYFFRGQLVISEPDQVVLGIIDPVQSSGFARVRFKVQNKTPGEDMTNGQLIAVAKFHRNNCYRPDLTGEFGAPGVDILACRDPNEQVVVSDAKTGETLVSGGAALDLTFNFNPPIPAGAMDLFLQVIYRGPLGSEPDAVAVTTLDLFEPTHIAFANGTDITEIFDKFYSFDQIVSGIAAGNPTFDVVDLDHDHVFNVPPDVDVRPLDWTNVPISFTGVQARPVATIASLPHGRFARITVLTARPVLDFYPGFNHFNPLAAGNQLNDAGTTLFVTPVTLFRGYYVTNADIVFVCLFWTSCNGNLLDIPPSTVTDALVPEAVTTQYP